MAEATRRDGDPVMVDYTPSSGAVSAGEVVLLGNTTGLANGIAHSDISNNALGSLAIGGGIYDVKVASNYSAYSEVFWDDTNATLTTTSTNMSKFGFTLEDASAANDVIRVLHDPAVSAT